MRWREYLGIALLSLFILLAGTAGAKTIVIPDDYPTIQEGVNAAEAGDTVLVLIKGTPYRENVRVVGKESLTIQGVEEEGERPVVKGSFTVKNTQGTEISNFAIEGGRPREIEEPCRLEIGTECFYSYGVGIISSDSIDIRANVIREKILGIGVVGSKEFRIFDNTFVVPTYAVITGDAEEGEIGYNRVEGFRAAAFSLWCGSQNISIHHNRVEGKGAPVYLDDHASTNCVYRNLFLRFGSPPRDDGKNNRWFEGSEGNYWEDWEDNDGFEKGVYEISGSAGSVDEHPFEIFQNFPRMKYLMLATPIHPEDGTPDSVVGDDFGGEGGCCGWRVCRWNWKTAEYYYYKEPPTPDPPPFEAGRGFWVIQDMKDSVDIDVFGWGASQEEDFAIPLNPPIGNDIRGLEQVGNPFPYTIDWANTKVRDSDKTLSIQEAAREGWVNGYAYTWDWVDSQYRPISPWGRPEERRIGEWTGFWVEQLNPNLRLELLIPPKKVSAPKVVAGSEEGWFLELSVRSVTGEFKDTYNGLGVRPDASSGPDQYDAAEFPPPTPSYVQLYFPHDDPEDAENYWQERPGKYTYDYRGMDWTEQVWVFEVNANVPEGTELEITWPNIDSVPRDYHFCLEDLKTGNRIEDMREVSSYTFNAEAGGIRRFQLVVSYSPTAVEEELSPRPSPAYALEQNIPNPFNARTRICYRLSEAARVKLTVFNLWGQRVRVLVDGYKKAGSHTVSWDGRDANGKEMATGIYLYRIEVGAFSQTKKMLLLR